MVRNRTHLALDFPGFKLIVENFGTVLFGLGLVNVFHQYTLVLEYISF